MREKSESHHHIIRRITKDQSRRAYVNFYPNFYFRPSICWAVSFFARVYFSFGLSRPSFRIGRIQADGPHCPCTCFFLKKNVFFNLYNTEFVCYLYMYNFCTYFFFLKMFFQFVDTKLLHIYV